MPVSIPNRPSPERCNQPVREFASFNADLNMLADWLAACGVDTVAMESGGVYRIPQAPGAFAFVGTQLAECDAKIERLEKYVADQSLGRSLLRGLTALSACRGSRRQRSQRTQRVLVRPLQSHVRHRVVNETCEPPRAALVFAKC